MHTAQGSVQQREPTAVGVGTVPYEGGNFANSKMDHFSLMFKTS